MAELGGTGCRKPMRYWNFCWGIRRGMMLEKKLCGICYPLQFEFELGQNRRVFHGKQLDVQKWKKQVFHSVVEWSVNCAFALDENEASIAAWLEVLVGL